MRQNSIPFIGNRYRWTKL